MPFYTLTLLYILKDSFKSLKTHLHRILGKSHLTYEKLKTILIRIELVVDAGPLTLIFSDPADALTPGNFLIGEPICTLPEPDFTGIPNNNLKRWR